MNAAGLSRPTPFVALLLAAAVALALWPSTRWVEFSSGSEQLVVAAALESSREGEFLVPTMNGEPRLRKPPLTTWLAMLAVPPAEARALAEGPVDLPRFADAAGRVRGVALLLGVAWLWLTYELGRVLTGDTRLGLAALVVCGTSYFFVDQIPRLTTDTVLAVGVAGVNVALAHAVLRGRPAFLVPAGLALGWAFLAKGPVGLLQTLVPAVAFVAVCRGLPPVASRRLLAWGVAGTAAFAAVALPWFVVVWATVPDAAATWASEVARTDATVPRSRPLAYLRLPTLTGVWTVFAVLGLLVATGELVRRTTGRPPRLLRRGRTLGRVRAAGVVWALLMVLAPVVVMTLFRDRKDRYLLPLLPPLAVLVAVAVAQVRADAWRRPTGARITFGVQWALLLVVAAGMPLALMFVRRDKFDDPTPWLTGPLPWLLAVVGLAVWAAFAVASRTRDVLYPAALVLWLFAANVFLWGYANSREGTADLRPLAEAIRLHTPNALLWCDEPVIPPGLLVYAGRVVRPVPETFDPSSPHVLIVRQRDDRTDPPPTPPDGWHFLTETRQDRSQWHAFSRPKLQG